MMSFFASGFSLSGVNWVFHALGIWTFQTVENEEKSQLLSWISGFVLSEMATIEEPSENDRPFVASCTGAMYFGWMF